MLYDDPSVLYDDASLLYDGIALRAGPTLIVAERDVTDELRGGRP